MARIFGWQADYAGCGYYRIKVPLDELTRRGHDTTMTGAAIGRLNDAMLGADVLIGQRVADPDPSSLWQCMALSGNPAQRAAVERRMGPAWHMFPIWQQLVARKHRQRLVFEVDDDLFALHRTNPGYQHYRRQEIRDNLVHNMTCADLVTVSTEPLADLARQHNRNVALVPNFVPADLLELTPPRRTDGIVTVGWAGSSTHAMDWTEVDDALIRFFRKTRHTELHLMGGLTANDTRVPAHRVRNTPWFRSVPEFHRAVDFHIGLAPLKEHRFNEAKSALKAMEYAALGIPVVASDVRPYREFVRHGETGYLAKEPADWVRYLRELANDPDMRHEMGEAARKLAAEHTVEKNGHLWESALLDGSPAKHVPEGTT